MIRLFKRAEKTFNKIVIPKWFIDKYGRDFYMEIDEENGFIKLIPARGVNHERG